MKLSRRSRAGCALPMLRGLRARQLRAATREIEPPTYRRPTLTAEDIYAQHSHDAREAEARGPRRQDQDGLA